MTLMRNFLAPHSIAWWEQGASIYPPRGKVAGRYRCFVFILVFLPLVIDFGRLPARSSP